MYVTIPAHESWKKDARYYCILSTHHALIPRDSRDKSTPSYFPLPHPAPYITLQPLPREAAPLRPPPQTYARVQRTDAGWTCWGP
jgi:hypothetical protein